MEHTHQHSSSSHNHLGHSHGISNYNFQFAIGIGLNIVFVVTEAGYGYVVNSLALMADAGHNLSDVLGLLLAWGATWLSKRKPNPHFTYGLKSSSILAALANAVLLLLAIGAIIWEAIVRLKHPAPVASSTVIVVAGIGIVINAATAWLFMSGRKTDLNIRGAYLHMAADAAVSFGVVIVGFLMLWTGSTVLDPLISILIALVVIGSTWSLLRESLNLALNAVPEGVDAKEVQNYFLMKPGVSEVHDLHIWGMSTTENALTVHLVMPDGHPGDAYLLELNTDLKNRFRIQHSTFQIEIADTHKPCELAGPETV